MDNTTSMMSTSGMTSPVTMNTTTLDMTTLFETTTSLVSTTLVNTTRDLNTTLVETRPAITTASMTDTWTGELNSSTVFDNLTTTPVGGPGERTPADMVVLICTPIVVLLGTAGNALCLVIMMRRHYRACSTGVYLFCLSLADIMFLFMNSMVMNFTRLTFDFDFRTISEATCKLYIYLLMTSKCFSAWFIVAVSVERLLAVSFPLKANVLATRRRAWMGVAGMVVVIGGVFLFPVFTYTHIDNGWWIGCDMAEHHKAMNRDIVLKFLDLVLHTLLPAVMLFACNTLLLRTLLRNRQTRASLGVTASAGSSSRKHTPSRLTAMLLILSGVFLLLNLPMALYLLASAIVPSINEFKHWELLYRIFYTLQISNSASNFALYCLSGPLFRRQVAMLCSCSPCCSKYDRRKSYHLVSYRSASAVSRSFRYEASPALRRSTAIGVSSGSPGGARDGGVHRVRNTTNGAGKRERL